MISPIHQAAALHQAGQLAEAEQIYRALLAENPDDVNALHLLGVIASQVGKLDDAEAMIRRAIQLSPDFPTAWNNLGYVYIRRNRHAEAMPFFQRAIDMQPRHPESYVNIGTCYRALNRLPEALAALETAVGQDPTHAGAHWTLALVLLTMGDYPRGFEEYEWRWRWREFPSRRWNFPQPQWDGSPLAGRTIFLHTEQGFGDSIQAIRYVPMIKAQGARVILQAEPELHALLLSAGGIDRIVGFGEPIGDFDVHLPLMSLPRAFHTTVATVPAKVPYLFADESRVDYWRTRLEQSGDMFVNRGVRLPHSPSLGTPEEGRGGGLPSRNQQNDVVSLNVGLCWSGKPTHRNDINRSLSPELLEPLAEIPGFRFISLQKDPGRRPPASLRLLDFTTELRDFADTAALIQTLDLVITVDTAVAHLAGALAKPVWTLIPFSPDWRWLVGPEASVWYPTMRLFRQRSPSAWPPVIARLAAQIKGNGTFIIPEK